TGLFMKNWEEDDDNGQCTAIRDLADASQVCGTLKIPLKTVNFSAEYWDQVFESFLADYRAGRTPNPDILCNQHIKFKAFLDFALDLGADSIATGHYARVVWRDGKYRLMKGLDPNKDQSYFLYTLGQAQLAKCLFPLGDMQKPEVRALARKAGFENSGKKDSTGICFIGERKFQAFLSRFLPARPGEIRTPDHRTIGRHKGLMYYTLGQRRGLGIGGVRGASEEPWYVLAKDLENNILIAGQGHHHPLLYHNGLRVAKIDWIAGEMPAARFRCRAKIRYRQADQDCVAEPDPDPQGGTRVLFDKPQRAITPGQSIVFYRGETCLGGGVIEDFAQDNIEAAAVSNIEASA
ncbi:MAG: tRNA 2-thiouridine(34) synthase MnmA, partial [Methylococcaceae bacterium]|nr:tRNA 2-thiouridine(34) synthase MnmA [Methylococcaceae bacterium]